MYNSRVFLIDYFSSNLAMQEIIIVTLVLAIFYFVVLLLIKIFKLGYYKDRAKELEIKIDKDRTLATAVFNYASIIIEINCTKDKITRLLIDSKDLNVEHFPYVAEFFSMQSKLYTHPDDCGTMTKITAQSLISDFKNGTKEKEVEYRSKRIESICSEAGSIVFGEEYFWFNMKMSFQQDKKTLDIIALLAIEEIHDEKEEELALRYQAETDSLTGAYNKIAFANKLNEYLERGSRGALYMFDIDNFKGINDNMGHSAGDEVLKEIYAKVYALFRSQDIIGRIGGDEFVVYLEGVVDSSIIFDKAERICRVINKKYKADNNVSVEISSSIGVALSPRDGKSFETLFNAADLAMYTSKNKGKNTFTLYDDALVNGFAPQEREAYMRLRSSK